MKYGDSGYTISGKQYDRDFGKSIPDYNTDCCDDHKKHIKREKCEKELRINNNPVIKINLNGSCNNPEPKKAFLSSYMEALGGSQTVSYGENIAFSPDSVDSVGNNITIDDTGAVFTINRKGLYHIEWNLNLASQTTSAVAGIVENGESASGSAASSGGSFSSGTLINVTSVPFTISLRNYNGDMVIEDIAPFENSAASIRIVRFADGPGK